MNESRENHLPARSLCFHGARWVSIECDSLLRACHTRPIPRITLDWRRLAPVVLCQAVGPAAPVPLPCARGRCPTWGRGADVERCQGGAGDHPPGHEPEAPAAANAGFGGELARDHTDAGPRVVRPARRGTAGVRREEETQAQGPYCFRQGRRRRRPGRPGHGPALAAVASFVACDGPTPRTISTLDKRYLSSLISR